MIQHASQNLLAAALIIITHAPLAVSQSVADSPPSSLLIPNTKPGLGQMHASAVVGCTRGAVGETFEIVLRDDQVVVGLIVFEQLDDDQQPSIVNGFQMIVRETDGAETARLIGRDQGRESEIWRIPEGQSLIGIVGSSGWWIDSIEFVLADGSQSPRYGGGGGDTDFQLTIANRGGKPNGKLRGFSGTAAEHLESIGLVFWPFE